MSDPIVIVSAVRTPIGGMLGDFASLQAYQLGAVAIKAAVERAGVKGEAVDEVLMGCCLMAGQGQAPARQATLAAGLPQSAGAVTLSQHELNALRTSFEALHIDPNAGQDLLSRVVERAKRAPYPHGGPGVHLPVPQDRTAGLRGADDRHHPRQAVHRTEEPQALHVGLPRGRPFPRGRDQPHPRRPRQGRETAVHAADRPLLRPRRHLHQRRCGIPQEGLEARPEGGTRGLPLAVERPGITCPPRPSSTAGEGPSGTCASRSRTAATSAASIACRRRSFGRDYPFLPRAVLLSFEVIVRLARLFVDAGVSKIRLTGGGPLMRRDVEQLIERLAALPGLEITLTTNGSLLAKRAQSLKDAGLHRITVSLDALDDAIYRKMNDVDFPVSQVLEGIEAAGAAGLTPVKINTVVKRGVNEEEILPLARHFRGSGHILRFIEYMDVGSSNNWSMADVVPSAEVIARIGRPIRRSSRPVSERKRELQAG